MEQNEIDAMLNNGSPNVGHVPLQKRMTMNFNGTMFRTNWNSPNPANPPWKSSAASFEEVQKGETPKQPLDLDFILDIPLFLTVELGRNRMLISELLQLGQGSVVELTKLAGEPMDVYVNQRLIARGEVVVVNEKFGVRLTDIVSPAERINKLK